MKVTKATKSQTNQLNIQTGDFYDGTHALQVRISGEVVYRSLKDDRYKSGKSSCIGLKVPKGQEDKVTKPICTLFVLRSILTAVQLGLRMRFCR